MMPMVEEIMLKPILITKEESHRQNFRFAPMLNVWTEGNALAQYGAIHNGSEDHQTQMVDFAVIIAELHRHEPVMAATLSFDAFHREVKSLDQVKTKLAEDPLAHESVIAYIWTPKAEVTAMYVCSYTFNDAGELVWQETKVLGDKKVHGLINKAVEDEPLHAESIEVLAEVAEHMGISLRYLP